MKQQAPKIMNTCMKKTYKQLRPHDLYIAFQGTISLKCLRGNMAAKLVYIALSELLSRSETEPKSSNNEDSRSFEHSLLKANAGMIVNIPV